MKKVALKIVLLGCSMWVLGCGNGATTKPVDAKVDSPLRIDIQNKDIPLVEGIKNDILQAKEKRIDLPTVDMFSIFDWGVMPIKDFVVDNMYLPVTKTDAKKYGLDLNGDGKVDNALGDILAGVFQLVPGGYDFQYDLAIAINSGALLTLLRVQAKDYTNDPLAMIKLWSAKPESCCTDPRELVQCQAQAKTTCFNGAYSFEPLPAAPLCMTAGPIQSGAFVFGPGLLKIQLTLMGSPVLTLTLKKGIIKGKIVNNQIIDGVIAGALPKQDVDNVIIPAVAKVLNDLINDPSLDATYKEYVLKLFDTDGDGILSITEVATNILVQSLVGGDVDVDYDNVKELSVGLGFTAVGALMKSTP